MRWFVWENVCMRYLGSLWKYGKFYCNCVCVGSVYVRIRNFSYGLKIVWNERSVDGVEWVYVVGNFDRYVVVVLVVVLVKIFFFFCYFVLGWSFLVGVNVMCSVCVIYYCDIWWLGVERVFCYNFCRELRVFILMYCVKVFYYEFELFLLM